MPVSGRSIAPAPGPSFWEGAEAETGHGHMKDHEGFCEFLCHQTHIDPLLGLLFCVQAGHVWKGVNGYKWLQLNTSLQHIKTSLIIIWPHFFGQCAQMSLRIHLLQNASGADGAAWQASCARRGPGTQISPLPSHDWQSQICFLLCCVNFVTPGSGSGPFAWAHWRATTCCRQRAKRPHISSNFLAFHHDTMVQGCQREAIISVFGDTQNSNLNGELEDQPSNIGASNFAVSMLAHVLGCPLLATMQRALWFINHAIDASGIHGATLKMFKSKTHGPVPHN